jgi:HlyD family secretion protein
MLKWLIVLLSAVGAIMAVSLATRKQPVYASQTETKPVRNPYGHGIAGAGLIEPAGEAVVIGVAEPGQVIKVWIKKGQAVKEGDPLFKTDARALENQLPVLEADVQSALAELERTRAYRRPEDGALLRAKVASAEAAWQGAASAIREAKLFYGEQEWLMKDQQAKKKRLELTSAAGASSVEELERVEFALNAAEMRWKSAKEAIAAAEAHEREAQAQLEQAKAELATFDAGAWAPDVKLAEAAVAVAKAHVEQTRAEIERRTVRAPLDAVVIRMNLREGEFATTSVDRAESSPVVLGNMSEIHVRIDIDEFEAEKFRPGMKANMFLRSDRTHPISLEYVSTEPYIIPKRSLTNSQRELVDTRVLQVIYKIADGDRRSYVGQQVDVFFDLDSVPGDSPAVTASALRAQSEAERAAE